VAQARAIRNLRCDEPFRSAAGKVIWTRFEEMMSFREAALAGEDSEGIHDMRVASRRLRAALEVFREVFPKRRLAPLLREVKALADTLGDVRDTDVMIERLRRDMKGRPRSERLVLSDMAAELQATRARARERLEENLSHLEDEGFTWRFLAMIGKRTT
jgi:CHAD domain-containing protein